MAGLNVSVYTGLNAQKLQVDGRMGWDGNLCKHLFLEHRGANNMAVQPPDKHLFPCKEKVIQEAFKETGNSISSPEFTRANASCCLTVSIQNI